MIRCYDQWKTAEPKEDYWDEEYCCVCGNDLPDSVIEKGDAFCNDECYAKYRQLHDVQPDRSEHT